MDGLDEAFWNSLLPAIAEGEVIPIVGPGAVTFGLGDELLYPWLARRIPLELDPPLSLDTTTPDLQAVVDAQRAAGQPIDRIYKRLYRLVKDPQLRPGATLAALAEIDGFQLFINTTFDPLLCRAAESARPGGQPEERHGAATLRGACPDLPRELGMLDHPYVYQILGQAEPVRDFVLWDDDMLHFLLRLNQQLPLLPRLSEALQRSQFLVLGLSFADWLLRFFVQVIKQQRLSELAGSELFVFEKLDATERDKVVVYFNRFTNRIRVIPFDPIEFVGELHTRWQQKHGTPQRASFDDHQLHREKHRQAGCIFVSYASPDLEVARYVVGQLQAAGCPVWFDKEQLQPGEKWEDALREAVQERCSLFVSLISDHTAQRLEAYNIWERNLAAQRCDRFADQAVFYLPVRIDSGEPLIPDNEPQTTKHVHAVRKTGGHLDPEFIAYVRQKQRENCAALGIPLSET
jgi:hypothetical protein